MLWPANDSDHILKKTEVTSLQGIKTIQTTVENLHVVLLCKRSHSVSKCANQNSISLPKRLTNWTFMNHLQQQLWHGQMSLVNDHVLHLKLQFQVAAFASFIL
jgi:hypothetical protein